jgi:hypothetical protein
VDEAHPVTRRVKAARQLAGFSSAAKLAAETGKGLADKTLRKIESGEKDPEPWELDRIARACGLPYEFFTIDFSTLPNLLAGDDPEHVEDLVQDRATQIIVAFMRLMREKDSGSINAEENAVLKDFTDALDAYEARARSGDADAKSPNATGTRSGGGALSASPKLPGYPSRRTTDPDCRG